MAVLRLGGTAWTSLDGRRHDLGAYKHDAQAGLATDLASLLQAHILARGGDGAAPQPQLSTLPAASVADLLEREDWAELCGQPSLEQAIQLLAESRLAEQLYYDLFSVETSEDEDMEEAVQAQEQQQQQAQEQQQVQPLQQPPLSPPQPAQQQPQSEPQQPQQQIQQTGGYGQGEPVQHGPADDASMAGQEVSLADGRAASIESIEDGELVGARLPSGLLAERSASPAQPPKAEPSDVTAGPATDGHPAAAAAPAVPVAEAAAAAAAEDVEILEAESGFEAEDAAAALQHLAALPSAAWQDGASGGEESEGEGGWAAGRKRSRAIRAPSRGPPERKQRKQRPAKLWCRYPLDESRWALILSSSAISSRQISLPWTQPGDMACELLGPAWVEAVRRRTQSGTVRETAVLLLEGDEGERAVSYALYQNTGASQKETRPQYLEKLHPVLQSRAAAVGDVLLLLPMGPGRLHAQLVKSDSEEARAVHAAMSFDVPGEQQAWQSKHPSRQPSRASSQHDLTQLEASPGAAAAAGAAELALAGAAPSPPLPAQAAEGRQPSPSPHHAAHRQEHVSPAGKPVMASADRQALEQAAAADALEEMMPHHKRPKWEHPSDGSPPAPAAAAAGAAAPAPGREVHRKPSGLSALLQHPAPMAHPPLPPAQQAQLRQAMMQQQMQQQIARVSAAQRHAQALNKPGSVQRPPAAAAGVIDTMTMGQTQLSMLQQYRNRLKEGSKEYEECSAHIAALQASMQHLSKFAKPPAPAAAAAPQPAARPPTAARPPAPTSLQQQMNQKPSAPRPQPPPPPQPQPQRPSAVPVLPKPAVPLPARPPGQPPVAMRQVQVMVAGRPMPMLVPAGMEGRVMQDVARMSALMARQPQQAAAMVAAMQQAAAAAAAAAAPRPAQPPAAAAAPAGQPGQPSTVAAAAPAATAPAGGVPPPAAQPAAQPVRPSSPGNQQAPPPHPTVSTPPPKPAAAPPVVPAAVPGTVQLARPAGNAPVIMMSKPMLIRSTTVPPPAPAPLPKPAQQAQQPGGGAAVAAAAAAAAAAPHPSAPTPAQAPAAQQATAPGTAQAQAAAQPVPDASVSLAHMQAALHSFAAGVAVRVPPGEEQRQHVNERLHALAGELDALLKGFWQQQPGAK